MDCYESYIRAVAHREPWSETIGVYLLRYTSGRPRLLAAPLEFRECPMTRGDTFPSFHLETREAQELMDMLWTCGVRPTEGKGSAGQLAAVEQHLADMRRIAFDKLKITT